MEKPRDQLSGLLEMEFMYALEEVNLLAISLTGWASPLLCISILAAL